MHNVRLALIPAACIFVHATSCLGQATSSATDAMPPGAAAARIDSVRRVSGDYFYLQLPAGSKDGWTLMVRHAGDSKGHTLLDPTQLAPPGKHAVLIDIEPSWDGKSVAVGATLSDSEGAVIRVVDVASGNLLKDSIPRTLDGDASWADDNKSFYYRQLQDVPTGSLREAAFDNMRAYLHKVGDEAASDKPVFGPDIAPELHLPRRGAVNAFPVAGTPLLLAVQSSAHTELDSFWVRNITAKTPAWRQIIDHKDQVLFEFALRGSMLYFVTKKEFPNGSLMAFDIAKDDISRARTILSASDLVLSDRDEDGVAGASDALYVYGKRNGSSVLLRISYEDQGSIEQLKLPVAGLISDVSADYREPGVVFTIGSEQKLSTTFTYDPFKKQFTDTQLQPR